MQHCETCGNEYDRLFEVRMEGKSHLFDCFECAIHELAPRCARCETRILGHGVQAGGIFYCGSHCARQQGVEGLQTHT